MKLKKVFSAFAAGAVSVSLIASTALTAWAASDYIISDEESTASKDWGQAITIQGSALDRSIFKEGCTVVVEHGEGNVEFILQSWADSSIEGCDKEIWARVSPDTDKDGTATFTYDDIYQAFIVDNDTTWDCLMAYHVGIESKDTVIKKAYITYAGSSEEKETSKKDETSDKASATSTIIPADAPTLSFDMNKWGDYVKLTPDASIAGISLSQTTTGQYQGATLNISVNMDSDLEGRYPTFAGLLNDDDGNPVYPEAKEDDADLVHMGLELNASDFGIETFDGCTITFKHLFNEDAAEVLLNGGIYIYPANDDYEFLASTPMTKTANTITRENIDTYANGFVTVPGSVGSTKIIIEIPLIKGYQGDILRIDNLVITLPGDEVIKNLDGYNDTAEPMNEFDGKIKITGSNKSDSTSSVAEAEKKSSVGFIVVIVLVVIVILAVVAGVVIFLLKNRSKYY